MNQKIIKLKTEKEFKIFMDPLRQRMLRTMYLIAEPMTAKKLADIMHITPSSAKHHLTQLETLGLVSVDHTEQIHGITAVFYNAPLAEVQIGLDQGEYENEREFIMENQIISIYKDFCTKIRKTKNKKVQNDFSGDCLTGIVYITQKQADELYKTIRGFIEENSVKSKDLIPFEYSLVLYNAKDTV